MIDLDVSFEERPWERFLSGKHSGDRINAAHFLTLLEEETEEAVEDAFAALEEQGLILDLTGLPHRQFSGQAALRLKQEVELAEKVPGDLLQGRVSAQLGKQPFIHRPVVFQSLAHFLANAPLPGL